MCRGVAFTVVAAVVLPALTALDVDARSLPRKASDVESTSARSSALDLPFVANGGQHDPRVAFAARSLHGTLFVTRDGKLVHSFPSFRAGSLAAGSLVEEFVEGRAHPVGVAASPVRVSRFVGNDPLGWQQDLPAFERLSLGRVWPGIDVEIATRGPNVEKLFIVLPGADASRIDIEVRGADELARSADGGLIARSRQGDVELTPPVAWQLGAHDEREVVTVAYAIRGRRYGFELGHHDPGRAVVIDPLIRSSYLGGSSDESADALAVDAAGNVFVAGITGSAGFPGTGGGAQPTIAGAGDAFVVKLDAALSRIIQATFLGGNGIDMVRAMIVDRDGSVLVGGSTDSSDFPATAGGAQGPGSQENGFVARLENDLRSIRQATYIGGNSGDVVLDLAVDTAGFVYATGGTSSTDLPGTSGGAQPVPGGNSDAFVVKLSPALTALVQSTYIGGSSLDHAEAIAIDAAGNVFVGGHTRSTDFPATASGAQPARSAFEDGFLARLNPQLTQLTRATYLGGNGVDAVLAIAIDEDGRVFAAGSTSSFDLAGTSGAAVPVAPGNGEAFVARYANGLDALERTTYLGGHWGDQATSLVLDRQGALYVAGWTGSPNLFGAAGGAQSSLGGPVDAFVAKLDVQLSRVMQATYFGGSSFEFAFGVALLPDRRVVIAGRTESNDIPASEGGAIASAPTRQNAYVALFTPSLALVDPTSVAPSHSIPALSAMPILALSALLAACAAVRMRRRA